MYSMGEHPQLSFEEAIAVIRTYYRSAVLIRHLFDGTKLNNSEMQTAMNAVAHFVGLIPEEVELIKAFVTDVYCGQSYGSKWEVTLRVAKGLQAALDKTEQPRVVMWRMQNL
jgi:hypothetical protein